MCATQVGITRQMDMEDVEAEIEVTQMKLNELEKVAPKLRKDFLIKLKRKAGDRGDEKKARQIWQIILREAQRKKWSRINWTTKKDRARSVVKVQLPDKENEDGTTPGEVFYTDEPNLCGKMWFLQKSPGADQPAFPTWSRSSYFHHI